MVAVCVAFVAALVTWTKSADTSDPSVDLGAATSNSTSSAPAVTVTPATGTADAARARSTPSAGAPTGSSAGTPTLPDLPQSTDVNVNLLPQHAVVITIVSDEPIAFVGYRVANGRPGKKAISWPQSPVRIHTVGRGTGTMAAVIAQAGPYATALTCSVSVDGKVRSTQTVTAAYRVVYCSG